MNKKIIIFRSNKYCYAQLISDNEVKWTLNDAKEKGSKSKRAKLLGEKIAQKLKTDKIEKVAFDRNGYKYHGRVKAVAEAMRSKGITI